MKRKWRFKSIKTRLTFWFLLMALFPSIIVGTIGYYQRASSIKDGASKKLVAVRDLKVDRINHWVEHIVEDIRDISEDLEIRVIENVIKKDILTKNDKNLLLSVEHLLKHYVKKYERYDEIFIINSFSSKVEVSTEKSNIGKDRSKDPYFTEPMKTRKSYHTDIYYSEIIKKPTTEFSIPIFCKTHDEHIVGILVARINLEQSLYNSILKSSDIGKTEETLIFNKDKIVLNKLRWNENAPLNLKLHSNPVILASEGKTGITEAQDYRNEKVLAAYAYIPSTGWGFIVKQDLKEIYSPIRSVFWNFLILLVILGTFIYIFTFFLAKTIAQPVLEIADISRRMENGELSARNKIMYTDEIGYLAESFNNMADSIVSQISIKKSISEITNELVSTGELKELGENLLIKLLEATDSELGALYLHNKDNNRFEHLVSIGVNPELLEPFDGAILEGEFGKALATKKISRIKNISKNTIFKFKTFTGTILPKEIITIPIVVENKVKAVICIASTKLYSKDSLNILDQSCLSINTAFSNLLANEETRKLTKQLSDKNTELQALADELQKQSEELQEQNVELEVQRQQVEEANRLKSEFLSNMSHELRTPLNSIMALSQVLMMQAKTKISEEEGNYLEIIERNGKKLLSLINDILDLSKIEAGKMDVNPTTFSLSAQIEMILDELEPFAKEKGIQIFHEISEDILEIKSDDTRVYQILQNIIGNALKFTEKGSVTISAYTDEEKVHVKVKDTGIGISERHIPHIFEEFRQIDGSSSRHYQGTGLGLAIASKAAKMLGGEISVESNIGKGSTFTVILPIEWQGITPIYETAIKLQETKTDPAKKTILIIDDEPKVASLISNYFSQEGFNTITATSGKEALTLAERHHPFAITLDIIMPDMDGWEILQNLKKNPKTDDIPVIIVSISDDKKTGFALGAVGYVTKPINRDDLISEIYKIHRSQPYSIMIVDNNKVELKEMAKVIEDNAMKAIIANSGIKCMELLKESVPDLLVLDLMMPEMDSFEVLEHIHKEPKTKNIPMIILTAKDLTPDDKKRLNGNISSILSKTNSTSGILLNEIKKILIEINQLSKTPKSYETKICRNILLVEDSEEAIIQVKNVLENEGYLVDVARGGQEAIKYVDHAIPDGIILDLMMPDVDGFEVLEKIRSTKTTAKIPVLILTAKDLTPEDFKRLTNNNVQQLIQKGYIDREGLLYKVRAMFGIKQKTLKPELHDIKEEIEKPTIKKGKPPRIQRENGRPTILVVEDNPDNMFTIKAILKEKYKIIEALDGEEGLKMAIQELPDLILLDISLPKMDGYAVVRKIKGDKKTCHIPVIALTAYAMKGDREKIIEAGCNDYISKPINPEKVLIRLDKWLCITVTA